MAFLNCFVELAITHCPFMALEKMSAEAEFQVVLCLFWCFVSFVAKDRKNCKMKQIKENSSNC